MLPELPLTKLAHQKIMEVVSTGDTVIDATVGNGHDTLFLAGIVGAAGKVYGFDIQQDALDHTWEKLLATGLEKQVSFYHAGHEIMSSLLPEQLAGDIRAVMFNLGYLPGGDKSRVTRTSTTLAALHAALQILSMGGRVTIMAYTGHPGGQQEADAVKLWIADLSTDLFSIEYDKPQVTNKSPPELITITKKYTSAPGPHD